MTALLVILAWVALSVLVTLAWVAYRTLLARHSLEECDPGTHITALARPAGLATIPVPGPRAARY